MPEQSAPERTLIHKPASYVHRLDWGVLFAKTQPIEVELGSGDGSFLANYAKLRPERNFLGVERLLGRLRKLNRKGLQIETYAAGLCYITQYFVECIGQDRKDTFQ